jgi:hypothetical protein
MAQLLDLQTPFLHSNNSGLEVAKTGADYAWETLGLIAALLALKNRCIQQHFPRVTIQPMFDLIYSHFLCFI